MNRHKIVIYSEHRVAASLVAAILDEVAACIICCSSYEQTIAICQRESVDLVIILAASRIIDGTDLIAHLRVKGESRPTVYVIAWQQSEQFVLSLLESGVDQYMTFPICMHRLRLKTEALLNNTAR